MASANWMKATRQGAGAMKKHLNQEDRVKGEHGNKHIDPELTRYNYTLDTKDYMESLRRLTARTKAVDQILPPKRKRQDRVTCCFIELPCSDAIRQQGRSDDFFVTMYQQLQIFFGKENVHGGFVHKDEIHDYYNKDGSKTTSLEHMHVLVSAYTPEKGINGKAFETKARLNALNKALDQTCLREFGLRLNTDETPQHKTVERLKEESELRQEAAELREAIKDLQTQKDVLTAAEVEAIKGEKTIWGGLKGVTYKEFEALKQTAEKVESMEAERDKAKEDRRKAIENSRNWKSAKEAAEKRAKQAENDYNAKAQELEDEYKAKKRAVEQERPSMKLKMQNAQLESENKRLLSIIQEQLPEVYANLKRELLQRKPKEKEQVR